MWIYVQKSGQLLHASVDEQYEEIGCGYSGSGACKNSAIDERRHNQGPIPKGMYQLLAPRDTVEHGPYVLSLMPYSDNRMYGRGGFLIHGDSADHPGTASEGCIILGRALRERIWTSGDRDLKVIADVPQTPPAPHAE